MSINAIVGVGKSVYKYGKQILKATPELTFGTSAEKVGSVLRTAHTQGKSLSETAKLGMAAVEKAGKGNFLKKLGKNLISLVPDLSRYTKAGVRLAGMKGTSKVAGAFKGLLKGVGKKLPFLFAALTVVTEIPNIIKATKEKGIVQGIKETIKPIARLAGAGVGSAIGSAICPGIGSLVGWIAGEWLVGKFVGKSYSEQQAEKEAIIAEYVQQQGQTQNPVNDIAQNLYAYPPMSPVFQGNNPYGMTNPFGPYNSIPYEDDIMMQGLPFNKMA